MTTHNTEQAARGLLMYQLAMRGYSVQFTDSRFPLEDLLCISPKGKHFGIDVKGQRTRSLWQMKEPTVNKDLFYAFVYVSLNSKPEIFILNSSTVKKLCDGYIEHIKSKNSKRKTEPSGLNWTDVHPFEGYDLLPK